MNYKAKADRFTDSIRRRLHTTRMVCLFDTYAQAYEVRHKLAFGNKRFWLGAFVLKEEANRGQDVAYFQPSQVGLHKLRIANPLKSISQLKPKTLFKYR